MWMEKWPSLKHLQNCYLRNQEKPRKPSVNLFGVIIELRNSHLLNTGKKRCGLCQVATSETADIYIGLDPFYCHSWPAARVTTVRHRSESNSAYWMHMVTVSMEQTD